MRGGQLRRSMLIGALAFALPTLGGCCWHKWHCCSPRDVRLGRPVCCDPCCGSQARLWVPGGGTPAGPCCPGIFHWICSCLKHGKHFHGGWTDCCGPTCCDPIAAGPVLGYPSDMDVKMPPARPEPPNEVGPQPRPLPKPKNAPAAPAKP